MKVLLIIFVILISGCSELKAELTGESYTIWTSKGANYKVNEYFIISGVINFTYNGSEYKSNVWTVKTTKVEG